MDYNYLILIFLIFFQDTYIAISELTKLFNPFNLYNIAIDKFSLYN